MRCLLVILSGLCLALPALADVVKLKGKATITGKVLAEKETIVAIDVGYTVLVIPREQVESITHGKTGQTAPAAQVKNGLYLVAAKPPVRRTVRQLVKQLGESVVQVKTPGGLGSGYIIREDGYLITNFHVIEKSLRISVEVYHQRDGQLERRTYRKVRIIAMNKFADLALLKITDADAPRFKPVPLGNEDALVVGEKVFAIGSPQGLERTVTEGILSTKTREMEGTLYLQTSTPINPGNSGGPLFNLRGEVVGVTNMKRLNSEALGFAIPVSRVKYFLDHRDAFAYDNDNPNSAFRYLPPPRRPRKDLPLP